MNYASGAITALDPEMVQVGDAVGQRAERCCLFQGAVRPVGVVEVLVLAQHDHQVPLVPDQRPPGTREVHQRYTGGTSGCRHPSTAQTMTSFTRFCCCLSDPEDGASAHTRTAWAGGALGECSAAPLPGPSARLRYGLRGDGSGA
jgi:hypothetical protein